MTDLAEKALKEIQLHPEGGVLQSELWKLLEIDSRKCSRVLKGLLDDGKVERIEYRREGQRTYLLKAKRPAVDPALLIAGGELLPASAVKKSAKCLSAPCSSTGCTSSLSRSTKINRNIYHSFFL